MFRIINLDNMATMKNVFNVFNTEHEAQNCLKDLASNYGKNGYQVENIPAQEGIMFNDPQMLKVTRVTGVTDPNATDNIIVYALVPCGDNELVTITRNRMRYYGEAEDETNYNFVTRNATINELHTEMLENGYKLVRQENGVYLYSSETDTFISEIYIF